jgi:hypothetical protein
VLLVFPHLWPAGDGAAAVQSVRAEPVSGEGHSVLLHERPVGPAALCVRLGPEHPLVVKVLEADRAEVAGEVFNCGSGEERDVIEIAEAVLAFLGKPKSLLQHITDRPGHVERLVCDSRKTARVLGWRARTRFDEGLSKTLAWYEANPGWWRKLMRKKVYQDFHRRWYRQTLGAKESR